MMGRTVYWVPAVVVAAFLLLAVAVPWGVIGPALDNASKDGKVGADGGSTGQGKGIEIPVEITGTMRIRVERHGQVVHDITLKPDSPLYNMHYYLLNFMFGEAWRGGCASGVAFAAPNTYTEAGPININNIPDYNTYLPWYEEINGNGRFPFCGLDIGHSTIGLYYPTPITYNYSVQTTLWFIVGNVSTPNGDLTWRPTLRYPPHAPGYTLVSFPAAVLFSYNTTHTWWVVSGALTPADTIIIDDILIAQVFSWTSANTLYYYFATKYELPSSIISWHIEGTTDTSDRFILMWWDKIPPITLTTADTLTVSYAFYTSFPAGGNFLAILASLLHQTDGTIGYRFRTTDNIVITDLVPDVGAARRAGSDTLRLPSLQLAWGTGTALVMGPYDPADLSAKTGETAATASVGSGPGGSMTITITGTISNPSAAPITVSEIGIYLGSPSPLEASMCFIAPRNPDVDCASSGSYDGKRLLIAYIPITPGIVLNPGQVLQITLRISVG